MSEESEAAKEIAQNQVNIDTAERLGEISSDVKTILSSQIRLFKIYDDHEKRITKNENALTAISVKIGMAGAVIGAVFSALADWLWRKINHFA